MMAQLPRLERRVKNVRNTQLALTFSIAMRARLVILGVIGVAIACFTSPSWGFAEACTGQGITTTPASRIGASSYELYRKQLDSAGTANVDLILLGDSLAQDWDSSLFTPTIKTINLGLGGDKTQNVFWRYIWLNGRGLASYGVYHAGYQ